MKGVLQIPYLFHVPQTLTTLHLAPILHSSVPFPSRAAPKATPCGASNPQRCEYNPRRRSKRIFTPKKGLSMRRLVVL